MRIKPEEIKVAYFSAEFGINDEIKTYAGGLGILAGDIIKSAADLGFPMCGVTLLYKKGFFKQVINEKNEQEELEDYWDYQTLLEDTNKKVIVNIEKRDVAIKIWIYWVKGEKIEIPIIFLDTDLPENNTEDREITSRLYIGDRLKQEIILGIGGIRALEKLGIYPKKYHMNEGHSSFLTLELYRKIGKEKGYNDDNVKELCVFTTHTPIPAGHDKFTYSDFHRMLDGEAPDLIPWHIQKLAGEGMLNTTRLAMSLSGYINAVSKKHQKVTKNMFPEFNIDYITNGVHLGTWVSEPFQELYNQLGNWKEDPSILTNIHNLENKKIIEAKKRAKRSLFEYLQSLGISLDENVLTIGFARRFIYYKNAELIFQELDRLRRIRSKIQLIYAGKSHMKDLSGKRIITRILETASLLKDIVKVVFIENYCIEVAKKLVSGCDVWLNTPIPPNEASGTSGMKATANGTLHYSSIDGWAPESFEKGNGGFPISNVDSFYDLLEYKIIPLYYHNYKTGWIEEMKESIRNGSYFNTHRVLKEYIEKAYRI